MLKIVEIEDNNLKIISVKRNLNNMTLLEHTTIAKEDLPNYLQKDKTKEYLIVKQFKNVYQTILQTPLLSKEDFAQYIHSHIQTTATDLGDFEFAFQIVSEVTTEARRYREVYISAVSVSELSEVVEQFLQYQKRVLAIYNSEHCISLLKVFAEPDPYMYVYETDTNKTLVLVKNNSIYFSRVIQSFERGITDIDVQSINMTINYCRQNFRITPKTLVFIGGTCTEYSANSSNFIVPFVCLTAPVGFKVDAELFNKYTVGLLSARAFLSKTGIDYLPKSYKKLFLKKQVLQYYNVILVVAAMVLAGSIAMTTANIIKHQQTITQLNRQIEGSKKTVEDFITAKKKAEAYSKVIDFANNYCCINYDISYHLHGILSLKPLKSDIVTVNELTITPSNEGLEVRISGAINDRSLLQIQKAYDNIVSVLQTSKDYELKKTSIDYKNSTFQIELTKRQTESAKQE